MITAPHTHEVQVELNFGGNLEARSYKVTWTFLNDRIFEVEHHVDPSVLADSSKLIGPAKDFAIEFMKKCGANHLKAFSIGTNTVRVEKEPAGLWSVAESAIRDAFFKALGSVDLIFVSANTGLPYRLELTQPEVIQQSFWRENINSLSLPHLDEMNSLPPKISGQP